MSLPFSGPKNKPKKETSFKTDDKESYPEDGGDMFIRNVC
jgi:hypothetical protein